MHCVSICPTPLSEVHLDGINYLRNFSKNVGLSEHSNSDKDGLKFQFHHYYMM